LCLHPSDFNTILAQARNSCDVAVAVAVEAPVTNQPPRAKRQLALKALHPCEPTGSGNSSGCWKCGSPNTTSSMSDYVAARVKQLREATILMNDNLRKEELKRKQISAAQREPHDKKQQRIKDSYSYCARARR
jgi:hypothetical protein